MSAPPAASERELAPLRVVREQPMTVEDIKQHVQTIQRVLNDMMIEGTHYGTIPGTQKPSLWKPGAELLAMAFGLRVKINDDPVPNDEGEVEYVCKVTLESRHGLFLCEGVGHYSTLMTKYRWREAVCREEFDSTPETRRRIHWKKRDGRAFAIFQVRQEPADLANTVRKMAKKSALIDAVLTCTAASDIFEQDLDDDDHTNRGDPDLARNDDDASPQKDPPRKSTQPRRQPRPKPQSQAANGPTPDVISDAQRGRFFAIWKGAGKTDEQVKTYLREEHGIDTSHHIRKNVYQEICTWAEDQSNNWTSE